VESLPGVGDAYSYRNAARQEQEQQDATTAPPISSTDASRPSALATDRQVIPLPGVGSSGLRFSDTPAPLTVTVTSIDHVNHNRVPLKIQIRTIARLTDAIPANANNAFLLPIANDNPFSIERFCRYIGEMSAPNVVFQKVNWVGKCSYITILYYPGITFVVSSTWLEEKLHSEQNVSSTAMTKTITRDVLCLWIREEYKASGVNAVGQPKFSDHVFWWSYGKRGVGDPNLGEGTVWPIAIGNITVGWVKPGCFMQYLNWEKNLISGGQT